MARDETGDVYVQRDAGGEFIGIATHLQSYEMYESTDATDTVTRYSPTSQVEELEREFEMMREVAFAALNGWEAALREVEKTQEVASSAINGWKAVLNVTR